MSSEMNIVNRSGNLAPAPGKSPGIGIVVSVEERLNPLCLLPPGEFVGVSRTEESWSQLYQPLWLYCACLHIYHLRHNTVDSNDSKEAQTEKIHIPQQHFQHCKDCPIVQDYPHISSAWDNYSKPPTAPLQAEGSKSMKYSELSLLASVRLFCQHWADATGQDDSPHACTPCWSAPDHDK